MQKTGTILLLLLTVFSATAQQQKGKQVLTVLKDSLPLKDVILELVEKV